MIRSIRGLALAESGKPVEALDVFNALPREHRNTASLLYEARTLQIAERTAEAAELVRKLVLQSTDLAMEEISLLKRMLDQLHMESPPGSTLQTPDVR